METPAPVRVRLISESTKPQEIRVVSVIDEWRSTGNDAGNPIETFGAVSNELFFYQPSTLGFDPKNARDEKDEEIPFRKLWADPAAAIIWMAIGTRCLKSQFFRLSCMNLARHLRLGFSDKQHGITSDLQKLIDRAQGQPDCAFHFGSVSPRQWTALWPYLTGQRSFFYRVLPDRGFIDEKAEWIWLSPNSRRSP